MFLILIDVFDHGLYLLYFSAVSIKIERLFNYNLVMNSGITKNFTFIQERPV